MAKASIPNSEKMPGKWSLIAISPILYVLITHLLHVLYFAGGRSYSQVSLAGKTVIVTGANTGIGKFTAMDMAARGARVILACRNAKKALPVVAEIKEQTKNPNVLFMALDLASFKSVQSFTDEFLKNEDRLDILINNAGMLSTAEGGVPELNENGIEITLMVNHLGPFLLTQNLLDILKKSGPGSRIVTVSSVGHEWANPNAFKNLNELKVDGLANNVLLERPTLLPRYSDILWHLFRPVVTQPANVRYANSKLANVLFSRELGKRLAGTGVTTYSLHPGCILTDIGVDRNTGKDIFGFERKNAMMEMAAKMPDFFAPLTFAFKTLVEGAQTTICCAVDEELADQSGLYYSDCAEQRVYREEMNDKFSATFWEWSEDVIREARMG